MWAKSPAQLVWLKIGNKKNLEPISCLLDYRFSFLDVKHLGIKIDPLTVTAGGKTLAYAVTPLCFFLWAAYYHYFTALLIVFISNLNSNINFWMMLKDIANLPGAGGPWH